jgi:hypothetical protein
MISLFNEKRIDDLLRIVDGNIQKHISQINENQLVTEDSRDLAKKVAKRFSIKSLEIDFNKRDAKVIMVDVPWDFFPPDYDVTRGNSYSCAKVLYTVQYSGDSEFLIAIPKNASLFRPMKADVTESSFTFGYQTLYGRQQLSEEVHSDVKRNLKQDIDSMSNLVPVLNNEINIFNEGLEEKAYQLIEIIRKVIKNREEQNRKLNDL